MLIRTLTLILVFLFSSSLYAQIPKAPEKKEGEGQFAQLIIRGVTLINGNGAPPIGPVDIVIEKNRIVQVASAGSPHMPPGKNRPKLKEGGQRIELRRHVCTARLCRYAWTYWWYRARHSGRICF